MMEILGMGHDVVDIDAFEALLDTPGSRMSAAFSARELRQCAVRARDKHDSRSSHLAVRWAGKESVFKAWCEAMGAFAYPYTVDDMPWSQVEILDDARGCPHVVLSAEVRARWERCATGSRDPSARKPLGPSSTGADARPVIDVTDARDREDSHGPGVSLHTDWHVSLSHDGDVASAVALVQGEWRAPARQ